MNPLTEMNGSMGYIQTVLKKESLLLRMLLLKLSKSHSNSIFLYINVRYA